MKVAIIGSRSLTDYDLTPHIPPEATEILSGGARGIDTLARRWAESHGIPCTELRPDYPRYGRSAPLKRNVLLVQSADLVLAVWDGVSPGTAFTIAECQRQGKRCIVIRT